MGLQHTVVAQLFFECNVTWAPTNSSTYHRISSVNNIEHHFEGEHSGCPSWHQTQKASNVLCTSLSPLIALYMHASCDSRCKCGPRVTWLWVPPPLKCIWAAIRGIIFLFHWHNCQKICLNHYLKFLSQANHFPELLTRNKMCWLEFRSLSFPLSFPGGATRIIKCPKSGNIEKKPRKKPRICQTCRCWRTKHVWHSFAEGGNPWNNWHLFQ